MRIRGGAGGGDEGECFGLPPARCLVSEQKQEKIVELLFASIGKNKKKPDHTTGIAPEKKTQVSTTVRSYPTTRLHVNGKYVTALLLLPPDFLDWPFLLGRESLYLAVGIGLWFRLGLCSTYVDAAEGHSPLLACAGQMTSATPSDSSSRARSNKDEWIKPCSEM